MRYFSHPKARAILNRARETLRKLDGQQLRYRASENTLI